MNEEQGKNESASEEPRIEHFEGNTGAMASLMVVVNERKRLLSARGEFDELGDIISMTFFMGPKTNNGGPCICGTCEN